MQTRTRSRAAVGTVAALLLTLAVLALPSTPAGAATPVTLAGATTSVTSSPGVTAALLRAGILPLPVGGATERLVIQQGGLGVQAGFRVSGGSVDPESLAGTVEHRGGLVFVNLARLKSVTVSDFRIVIDDDPRLIATKVNGAAAELRVFDLDLSKINVKRGANGISISGITPVFTADAAAALNAALATSVFSGGLVFGTGQTRLVPAS